MNAKNPALWENGQYLMEGPADPANKNRFSDAAKEAQASVRKLAFKRTIQCQMNMFTENAATHDEPSPKKDHS